MKSTFELYRQKTEIILTDEAETDNEDKDKSQVEGPPTKWDQMTAKMPQVSGYIKSFYGASQGAQLKYDEYNKLGSYEPELRRSRILKIIRFLTIFIIGIVAFFSIVVYSLSESGNVKSEVRTTVNTGELEFDLTDPQKMLSIQQFTNVSTYELEEVMDCNQNQNEWECFKKEIKKCDLQYTQKRYVYNNRYYYCKQSAYMRFKSTRVKSETNTVQKDNFEFCKHTFRPWNTEMFTQEEKAAWSWDKPNQSIFGQLMLRCYKNNLDRMKEFCDDTAEFKFGVQMNKRQVYDCYKQYGVQQRASISKQVSCEEKVYTPVVDASGATTKSVTDLKFDCLKGKNEDISDYCYQKVLNDGWTHEQYMECSKRDDIKLFKEGDAFIQKLNTSDFSVLNYPDNYHNNTNYKIYLEQIENSYGLDKPIQCALQLEYFFELPRSNELQKTTANTTLKNALKCFKDSEFPIELRGCIYKYDFEKESNLDFETSRNDYLSECLAGESGGKQDYLTEDQQNQKMLDILNEQLRVYEGNPEPYFEITFQT